MKQLANIQAEYTNYSYQKCFVAYSLGAEWSEDLKSACATTLPKFSLEPWYAAEHFDPTQPLRDKVVELIANSRYGIYDISSWQDNQGYWHLPRNVFIELGIAIAFNRPTLLLCHSSNQHLPLPACLQGVEIVEFSGDITLKKELGKRLPHWLDVPPERDWLNRFCIFGNRVCSFREQHPCSQQWGQQTIHCHISDGLDTKHSSFCQSECDEVRGAFEEIFSRFSDLEFYYFDELTVADGYQLLTCSHCQTVRSTPFAIYRITPTTSAETFVSIGISIAIEKLFDHIIPKILLVKQEQEIPSLLRGYEILEASGTGQIRQKLKSCLPNIIKTVRATTWRPRPLPFIETPISSETELPPFEQKSLDIPNQYAEIPIEELRLSVRAYNCLKRANIHSVANLATFTPEDLLSIKGFGHKSNQEVAESLRHFAINWGDFDAEFDSKLQDPGSLLGSDYHESLSEESLSDINLNNEIPIEELRLSVRTYTVLKNAKIDNVSDLLDFSQEDLLELKNFGGKSADELFEVLQTRLGITLPSEFSVGPSEKLSKVEADFLLKDSKILSIRERDVLKLRYGLADGREKTLSEIGQIFNISSERARVIEKKALGKLKNALTKASS
ncbi:hypothetical protein IQ254_12630 [Nodosilinea sp. LEGE 07088]|nr:DNA-directed RNA polymerase subunit alpha C-terminal domain-containing protein [Nodosilinea sp. LEGE 07088]MBE9138024.1 hypothetical protein [Nodosilinea sp. LEGE 07088]